MDRYEVTQEWSRWWAVRRVSPDSQHRIADCDRSGDAETIAAALRLADDVDANARRIQNEIDAQQQRLDADVMPTEAPNLASLEHDRIRYTSANMTKKAVEANAGPAYLAPHFGWRKLGQPTRANLAAAGVYGITNRAMAVHDLKCNGESFARIKAGTKRADLRWNDRDYRAGDVLILRRIADDDTGEIGRAVVIEGEEPCLVRVTHVLLGGQYGLAEGWAMLSLALVELRRVPEGAVAS